MPRFLIVATWTFFLAANGQTQEVLEPFAPVSSVDGPKWIVVLITDEDSLAWTEGGYGDKDNEETPRLWCEQSVRDSMASVLRDRPALKGQLLFQRFAAGTPSILTGGKQRPWPRRAILAICDSSYRLLGFSVGVPQTMELHRMLEDAQESLAILNLHPSAPKRIAELLADRAADRIDRSYTAALRQEMADFNWEPPVDESDPAWPLQYARVANELNPIYQFDAKLRFELQDNGDPLRLRALEQHIEARNGWCQAIAPFCVRQPADGALPSIVDSVWMETPIFPPSVASDDDELTSWFKTQRENSLVVLAIRPPLLQRQIPWPPPMPLDAKRAGRSWRALEKAMSEHSFRTVDAAELAMLLHSQDEQPIDLTLPSRARYVFFEKGDRRSFVIREGDLPAKFLRRF